MCTIKNYNIKYFKLYTQIIKFSILNFDLKFNQLTIKFEKNLKITIRSYIK